MDDHWVRPGLEPCPVYDSCLSATEVSLRSAVTSSTAPVPLAPSAEAFSSSSIFFLAFSMFCHEMSVIDLCNSF